MVSWKDFGRAFGTESLEVQIASFWDVGGDRIVMISHKKQI